MHSCKRLCLEHGVLLRYVITFRQCDLQAILPSTGGVQQHAAVIADCRGSLRSCCKCHPPIGTIAVTHEPDFSTSVRAWVAILLLFHVAIPIGTWDNYVRYEPMMIQQNGGPTIFGACMSPLAQVGAVRPLLLREFRSTM